MSEREKGKMPFDLLPAYQEAAQPMKALCVLTPGLLVNPEIWRRN